MTIPPPKVTSQHLARKAVVYLRQSSAKQVHENLQSQRLQYALREKAITWGFRDVEIIDEDLDSSAALGARERDGFTQLLGRVALGEVGLVLSIEKARRGELFRIVAPGYRCDGEDRLVKDPDLRVQTAIQLVFTKFRESWSGRQTHMWFIANQVSLPVNRCGNGKVTIEWVLPALGWIKSILKNPIYAGAYVYGRKPTKMVVSEGRILKRAGRLLPVEE